MTHEPRILAIECQQEKVWMKVSESNICSSAMPKAGFLYVLHLPEKIL